MSLQRNYYEVIGVPPQATTDEIKKKYRELARQFHPDVIKDKDKTLGQKVFTQINQAYRVLADPEKRSQYDSTLVADKGRTANVQASSQVASNGTAQANSAPLTAAQSATLARLVADAEAAMMENKLGNVKIICDKVLASDPRNVKALSILGDALVQMGKPRDAAIAYRRALQVGPSALLQSKLTRLEGAPVAAGTAPRPGVTPATGPAAPNRTNQNRTDQNREEKPSGGLLGRLLGKK